MTWIMIIRNSIIDTRKILWQIACEWKRRVAVTPKILVLAAGGWEFLSVEIGEAVRITELFRNLLSHFLNATDIFWERVTEHYHLLVHSHKCPHNIWMRALMKLRAWKFSVGLWRWDHWTISTVFQSAGTGAELVIKTRYFYMGCKGLNC